MKLGSTVLPLILAASLPLLGQEPPPKLRADAYGDALPAGALSRLGTSRLRHGISLNDLIFSADGKTVATGSLDEGAAAARLWDVATGKEIRRFEAKQDPDACATTVNPLALSPDGKILAGVSLKIRLWDVATGRELRRMGSNQDQYYCIAFSPDGKTLAAGDRENRIKLWEVATGSEIRTFKTASVPQQYLYPLLFSPDGKRLASGGEGRRIQFWNVETGDESGGLLGHTQRISALAFSPDGKSIASGSHDKTVRVWDVAEGRERAVLTGHEKDLIAVGFSPDGRTVMSADYDSTIRLWDAVSGSEVRRLDVKGKKAHRIAFAPDGKSVALGSMAVIRFVELSSGKELHPTPGHDREVRFMVYSPDGRTLVTGAGDDWIRVWDLGTATELGRFEEHISAGGSLMLSPDGKTLAVGTWDSILHWDLARKTEIVRHRARARGAGLAVFSPDGRTIAWGVSYTGGKPDPVVHLMDGTTGQEIRGFVGHEGPISTIAFSHDGKTLASASTAYRGDNTIRIWDVEGARELRKFEAHAKQPDGRPVMGRVAFSPDLSLVACADESVFTLRETATGRETARIELPGGRAVSTVAFTPDGRYLAAGEAKSFFMGFGAAAPPGPGHIRVWETATGKPVASFEDGQGRVESLAFSPDGRTLASGGYDTTILFWDLTPERSERPRPDELAALWKSLAEPDAEAAYRSVWRLVLAGDAAVTAIMERLRPVRADPSKVRQWIADLSSPSAATQLKASKMLGGALNQAGTRAEFEKVLASGPPEALRNRLEALLAGSPDPTASKSPEGLRMSRALYALERIATEKAKEALKAMSDGEPSRLSREAREGLGRIESRGGAK